MKTERRHELQTNVLADTLERWIEAAKPYSRAMLAGLIAACVLLGVWAYLSNQTRQRASEGWNEYYDAMMTRDPREALNGIVSRFPGTPVGHAARVVLADIQLDDGTNRLFIDKAAGRDELQKAAELYQAVMLESDEPSLQARATFGLARAHEALGKDLKRAIEEYRSIGTKWPNSPYVAEAEARAKNLESGETKDFYDWFAKYERPKPLSGEPGVPGARPDFMKDPLEGEFKVPQLDQSLLPQLAPGATSETPAAAPEGSTSADSAPAGETAAPVAENPPADTPPPAENPAEPSADPGK